VSEAATRDAIVVELLYCTVRKGGVSVGKMLGSLRSWSAMTPRGRSKNQGEELLNRKEKGRNWLTSTDVHPLAASKNWEKHAGNSRRFVSLQRWSSHLTGKKGTSKSGESGDQLPSRVRQFRSKANQGKRPCMHAATPGIEEGRGRRSSQGIRRPPAL